MSASEQQKWPNVIWIVRHGESAGNVAREAAYRAGLARIDLDIRDIDVPLSPRGEQQARALGHWFGQLTAEDRPSVVLTSPYLRAARTADLIIEGAGLNLDDVSVVTDERLREKEFGILDRLTRDGIGQHHPEQAELRLILGKFYHRPPGGESWCDVILRLRSVIDTLTREYRQERVLIVCHAVVVLCFRYLLERLTEQQILEIDRVDEVANCSVTRYSYDPDQGDRGNLLLRQYNTVVPLLEEGAPVTAEPDVRTPAP
jgi:2,3-bisphosphoglycerate-dependent phosphoglycerate mutase